jgi:predicted GNAT family acetyltransferase
VAALSQHLLDEGFAFTSLFTDLANPTSNQIYMKIGYQPLADFEKFRMLE